MVIPDWLPGLTQLFTVIPCAPEVFKISNLMWGLFTGRGRYIVNYSFLHHETTKLGHGKMFRRKPAASFSGIVHYALWLKTKRLLICSVNQSLRISKSFWTEQCSRTKIVHVHSNFQMLILQLILHYPDEIIIMHDNEMPFKRSNKLLIWSTCNNLRSVVALLK